MAATPFFKSLSSIFAYRFSFKSTLPMVCAVFFSGAFGNTLCLLSNLTDEYNRANRRRNFRAFTSNVGRSDQVFQRR